MHEPTRDFEATAHPSRVSLHERLPSVPQPHLAEKVLDSWSALAQGHVEEARVNVEIFVAREVDVGGQSLRYDADCMPHTVGVAPHVDARDACLARRDRHDPGEHAHQRGLPRAVGSEQPEQLAVPDLEIDVVHGREVAKALYDLVNLDCIFGVHRTAPSALRSVLDLVRRPGERGDRDLRGHPRPQR